jgi:hypothetical protein
MPQNSKVMIGVQASNWITFLAGTKEVTLFSAVGSMRYLRFFVDGAEIIAWKSVSLVIPYEWIVPDGTVFSVDFRPNIDSESYS